MKWGCTLLFLTGMSPLLAAGADYEKCAVIVSGEERLACYDQIAAQVVVPPPAPGEPVKAVTEQRPDGLWHLRADAAHKRINQVPYRADEAMATWSRISAPLLWVEGQGSRPDDYWGGRYSRGEFRQRLAHVPQVTAVELADAGHMLHHDQPQALARALDAFLSQP